MRRCFQSARAPCFRYGLKAAKITLGDGGSAQDCGGGAAVLGGSGKAAGKPAADHRVARSHHREPGGPARVRVARFGAALGGLASGRCFSELKRRTRFLDVYCTWLHMRSRG